MLGQVKPPPVRVTLTPRDGEPLALYAAGWSQTDPTHFAVTLAFDYPDVSPAVGWAVKGRGFKGVVASVDGRTLTCEVTP